jgi:outer membrane protein OmpA-like peptidoglycan-associated protein
MRRCLNIILGLGVLAVAGCEHSPSSSDEIRDLSLISAVDYLVEAFDRVPLVAFSEPGHAAGGTKEFLTSLIRHPRFAATVNDIVVEFGNARYQSLADRFVNGEPVSRDELKQIWENTTVVSGIWTAPVYEGFLNEVRALNAMLPSGRRVRVLLGDPPVDWGVVRGPADEDMNDWRDAHFAWVVDEQVMKKQRRALIWIGGAHISRRVKMPDSLIHLLDQRFPKQTLVAVSLDSKTVGSAVSGRLGPWPSLMAAPVHGTWLGRLRAEAVGFHLSSATVEENIDVAVFWESPSRANEVLRIDDGSAAELRRRQRLAEATIPFRGGRIRFEQGAVAPTPASEPALRDVLRELQRDPELRLLVKAFADARETDGQELSLSRARRVVEWLSERGIARERLVARGCGSSRALWVGDTEEERAANRKAELVRHSTRAGCEPPASFDF